MGPRSQPKPGFEELLVGLIWFESDRFNEFSRPATELLTASNPCGFQEAFLQTLRGEDLLLARATGCSGPADLEREKQKKKAEPNAARRGSNDKLNPAGA